ncbi:MAG: alpha-L-rhamnosidase N-terminal domain-containing protein, partial [Acidobacteriaceae bacterium]|nr:alpha-L-rhamnosidase N-terminal domain-containing protein [Acidobacteriaceae bacterium]
MNIFVCLRRVVLSCAAASLLQGASDFDFVNSRWPASWIRVPGSDPQGYGVYHFRKAFSLNAQPDKFVVFVSGDNRYQLYVNGMLVSWGPARSDLYHWRYEVVDVAVKLHPGTNVFAAVVWNDGPFRAVAQNTNETAFLLQAEDRGQWFVDTGKTWKCTADKAYSPLHLPPNQMIGYQAVGANEVLDAKLYPWGWERPGYDDALWAQAEELSNASGRDSQDAPNRWMLVPRYFPLEEMTPERIPAIRRADSVTAPRGFPQSTQPFSITPHSHASLLLDQSYLTTAYPELTVSGGQGATITLRYAESLYESRPAGSHQPPLKGNRNQIAGKVL